MIDHMFKVVTDQREFVDFQKTFSSVYEGEGYEFDKVENDEKNEEQKIVRYVVETQQGCAGTVEIKPFSWHSDIVHLPSFEKIEKMTNGLQDTYEIGRLTVIKEQRSSEAFDYILGAIKHHALQTQAKFYIALMDTKVYLALVAGYRIPIVRIDQKFFYKGHFVVPVCIDVQQALAETNGKKWLSKSEC